jgi:hypothetical protein
MTDPDLARLLSLIAQDLDARCYPGVGILRVAARRLLELGSSGPTVAPDAPRCPGCGDPLPAPARTGRPRKWCGPGRCRKPAKRRL